MQMFLKTSGITDVSLYKLKALLHALSSVSEILCDGCQLGKHHRITFPAKTDEHRSQLISLIHSDAWSPIRIQNEHSFAHYVIFVDDYSCMT